MIYGVAPAGILNKSLEEAFQIVLNALEKISIGKC